MTRRRVSSCEKSGERFGRRDPLRQACSKRPHFREQLLLGLVFALGCAAPTHAPAEPTPIAPARAELPPDSTPPTASPQPDTEVDSNLREACPAWDTALGRVARELALEAGNDQELLESSRVEAKLREQGAPYVWPRAWTLSGGANLPKQIEPRLVAWLASQPVQGERRCGGALVTTDRGHRSVSVVAVDAVADLDPLPARVRVGGWVDVQGRFLIANGGAKVIVLGPRGRPYPVPTSLHEAQFRARFAADREGPWLIQVLGELEGGPRPVLEALVIAGDGPRRLESSAAPGESAPSTHDAAGLLGMLNAARDSERVPRVHIDPTLAALAAEQAEALRAAHRLAHDLGTGDPSVRVESAGLDALVVGENLAHADTLGHAHRALWASPSHRANMLDDRFDSIGIGVSIDAEGAVWVVELFARLAR